MATNYPGGRPSSRVKDLVDLVVIAHTQRLNLGQLRIAIATKCALSDLKASDRFTIPQGWDRRYRDLAARTPAADGLLDVHEAQAFVAKMVDPALAPDDGPAAIWVPGAGWTDSSDVEPGVSE